MEIIQVRSRAKSLSTSLQVGPDMVGTVGGSLDRFGFEVDLDLSSRLLEEGLQS